MTITIALADGTTATATAPERFDNRRTEAAVALGRTVTVGTAGWRSTVEVGGLTLGVSHVDSDPDGAWGIDSTWRGNFPVHANGVGARFCRVSRPAPEVEAALTAAIA